MPDRFIVAEVSKNWINGHECTPGSGLLAEQFERVIAHNQARGYGLLEFRLHRLMTGPVTLEAWPFETRRSAGSSNIGAVRLPADLAALVPMALALLQRPWEAPVPVDGLAPVFAPVAIEARRLARQAGRP